MADFKGATFRDYYASVVPWPIPDWFTPHGVGPRPDDMVPPPEHFTYEQDNPATFYYGMYKFYDRATNYWDDDTCRVETGGPVPHSFKDEVSEYWGAYDYRVAEINTWQRDYDKERYFQWRWYYADEMLIKREGGNISN